MRKRIITHKMITSTRTSGNGEIAKANKIFLNKVKVLDYIVIRQQELQIRQQLVFN